MDSPENASPLDAEGHAEEAVRLSALVVARLDTLPAFVAELQDLTARADFHATEARRLSGADTPTAPAPGA